MNLALVQKAAGRTADARDLLRRAVTIDPRNPARITTSPSSRTRAVNTPLPSNTTVHFCKYGSVSHNDLVVRVRARLAALAG